MVMSPYKVKMSHRALRDLEKLQQSHLSLKARELVDIIAKNPWQTPPSYEKLLGNLRGFYSRRINRQHRLVYFIEEKAFVPTIVISSMWTHYE